MNYAGKRVIVDGVASELGAATARILVDAGAEVHAIDAIKPPLTGLASFTECDLADESSIDAAVKKIGKIINALFDCVGSPHLIDAVIPMMIEGSWVVTIGAWSGEQPAGIRIVSVTTSDPQDLVSA